jgi:hypothetical protein
VAGSAPDQCRRLVDHEVAGHAAVTRTADLLPEPGGVDVVLIPGQMATQERTAVDEDYPASPYR